MPSPKVIKPPCNLNVTVGSKAVFTCDFEASTDNTIAQIHWEFNGNPHIIYYQLYQLGTGGRTCTEGRAYI